MRRWQTHAALFGLGLASLACGETEPKRGSLMLAVSTDMYINKDLGRVDIVVQPEHGPTQSTEVNLFPELGGKFLPGTFAVVEGDTPGEFVRIRVIARKGTSVRVVREAATRIPRERSALLSMPIQWLCDGQVKEDGQLYRSDCDEDYTCVGGVCKSALVDETQLPDYAPARVFGGGTPAGGGECFDTAQCFSGLEPAPLDLETCQVEVPGSGPPNVAVLLPPGSDGNCGMDGCLIPLEQSQLSGFHPVDSDTLQLPDQVCAKVQDESALGVVVSTRCDSKLPNVPTCGPWSLVGTDPGGEPATIQDPGGEAKVDSVALLTDMGSAVDTLADIVGGSCAALLGMSLTSTPTPERAVELCDEALSALGPALPLEWHHIPERCWVGAEAQLECERKCDPTCDPGTIEGRCEAMALVGQCDGTCGSRLCLGNDNIEIACEGYCSGECNGQCEGTCFGECLGTCDLTAPEGYCNGYCSEQCTGLCEGRCQGKCTGHCDGDPQLAATGCAGDCAGGCDTELSTTKCEGPLGQNQCNLPAACADACQAEGFFALQCDKASAWVMPQEGLDEATRAALEQSLAELLPAYEIRTQALLQGLYPLEGSLASDATASQKVSEAIAAINAMRASMESLLFAVGDSRGGDPGGSTVGPGPVDCEPYVSQHTSTRIDDFEDDNDRLPGDDGRDGGWYFYNDGTGTQTPMGPLFPEPGGPDTSTLALHTAGSGFTDWGAGVGFDFRAGSGPYDASPWAGLRFWARGQGSVRVRLMEADLVSGHPCGGCDPTSGMCDQPHTTEVFLSTQWTAFDLPWGAFESALGTDQPVNTTALLGIQFETPAGTDFDFWLDDLEFY